MDKKSNIMHSEQLLIGYDINDNIMEFIDFRFNKIIIFTQQKIKNSYNKALNTLKDKYKAKVVILDDGEASKSIPSAIKSISCLAKMRADKNSLLIVIVKCILLVDTFNQFHYDTKPNTK